MGDGVISTVIVWLVTTTEINTKRRKPSKSLAKPASLPNWQKKAPAARLCYSCPSYPTGHPLSIDTPPALAIPAPFTRRFETPSADRRCLQRPRGW
ncbi:hypothetical protein CA85_29400 [Allorhodopirellula solitaria]|uniref:Uncharacterized protein n=1 Tax=Allorhodopirellula solitaria TaxID=2527987 RepID=A0A5C5XTQ6_9BACT|nr:hypothetical protein CA85_29400 [Allorhodopirellula solitaria]